MKILYLTFYCFFLTVFSINAQYFPGGVADAEVWYVGDWDDIGSEIFANSAQTDIKLKSCGENKQDLFNFNASIYSDKLCLRYIAPLENTTGRDVFFVGQPNKLKPSYSHLGTQWNPNLNNIAETDSIVRNFIDLNNKNLFGREIYAEYISDQNANVNFYHTNNYNIDKNFKSYGQLGETAFYIGSKTIIDPQANYLDEDFAGKLPEFISFTRELSFNERNRVESYLALKYGLTLDKNVSYLDSDNRIFWNKLNNEYFPFRIFGFGKDNTSSLNQLQSQSTHLTKHLVAAIGSIEETNMEKQESVDIRDHHYLVFGDNGGDTDLANMNTKQVKYWDKVWLAQRTGKEVPTFPISFELHLTDDMIQDLNYYPNESLWLMKDQYVENDEVSDFEGENIQYYLAEVNLNEGIAYFSNVHFDADENVYDQFTFGIGPKMIVQTQTNGCSGDDFEVIVNITGGNPNYTIAVESGNDEFDMVISNTIFSFDAVSGVEYEIKVTDAQGLESETTITPESWDFELELGPMQILSATNQEITLDAGQGITDPNATYEWFQDWILIPENGSVLVVNSPGLYIVKVTSGDLSCIIIDGKGIATSGLNADISIVEGCDEEFNAITVNIENGFPPYVTSITGPNGTINYAHSGSTTIFDLPYGMYTTIVTDAEGNEEEDDFTINAPPEGLGLDIYSQLDDLCSQSDDCYQSIEEELPLYYFHASSAPFDIDASIGVDYSNISYEWFLDGAPLGINSPLVTFVPGTTDCYNNNTTVLLYTVTITDFSTNCTASQSFYTRGMCPGALPLVAEESLGSGQQIIDTGLETRSEKQVEKSLETLVTKVYPNPSQTNSTFTYEVSASEVFNGTVDVLTFAGAKLFTINIEGKSNYSLPLKLSTSGMYLIKTTTSIGVVKTDRIIIN